MPLLKEPPLWSGTHTAWRRVGLLYRLYPPLRRLSSVSRLRRSQRHGQVCPVFGGKTPKTGKNPQKPPKRGFWEGLKKRPFWDPNPISKTDFRQKNVKRG